MLADTPLVERIGIGVHVAWLFNAPLVAAFDGKV